jgi:hypothetical protein
MGKNPARQGQGDIENIPASVRGWGFDRQNETIGQESVSAHGPEAEHWIKKG